MNKIKKLLTMGLAVTAAVSAMSISAFADEDETILSVLGENGQIISYTQDEINELNGEIPAYGNTTIKISENSNYTPSISTRSTGFFTSTSIPVSSRPYNIYDAKYEGSFSIPNNSYRYSAIRMYMSTSSSSATVEMSVTGAKNSDGVYENNFANNFYMSLFVCEYSTSTPYVSSNVTYNKTITIKNMDTDNTFFMGLNNDCGTTANGTAFLRAY